jgi:hypothetical protein
MAAPVPLFQQYTAAVWPTVPNGVLNAIGPGGEYVFNPPWPEAHNQVHFTLSSGETVYIGTVLALCQLVTLMLRKGQHMICPTEDVFIALAGPGAKIIIGEMTFQNQKLINSGCFVYAQGRLEVWARNGSCIHSLDEALLCVGHHRTSVLPYRNTADLLFPVGVNSPRLIVVDYRYDAATPHVVTFVDDDPFEFGPRL